MPKKERENGTGIGKQGKKRRVEMWKRGMAVGLCLVLIGVWGQEFLHIE